MKLSAFEGVISVDEVVYALKANEHERCTFSLTVSKERSTELLGALGCDCSIDNDDGFSFSGTVTEVGIRKHFDHDTVTATVTARTAGFDKEPCRRVFQSKEMRLSDVVKNTGMSSAIFLSDDPEIKRVVVQDDETDWEFLKRVAELLGLRLYPDAGGSRVRIGPPEEGSDIVEDNDIIEIDLSLSEGRAECRCRLRDPKRLMFGRKASILGKELCVDAVIYRKVAEEYRYEYHLMDTAQSEKRLPTYSLLARTADNEDPDRLGRIKLEYLEPYEDVLRDEAIWTPRAEIWASKGIGAAIVPRKDDVVRVEIRDGLPEVISSVRTEAMDARFEKPDTRYLILGENTHIEIDDDRIVADNKSYKLEITREKAVVTFGGKVTITAEDGRVAVETGGVSAEFACDVNVNGGNVNIKGSKINISGSSGVSIA